MLERGTARDALLGAALALIREKGYSATTVDDLCARARVTKGAFFHHFKGKEALGVAAAEHWSKITSALFEQAPYHAPKDPLERVLAYIDFRRSLMQGELAELTCVVGTMVQEVYARHPEIREACAASIFGHAETLVADIEAARVAYGVCGDWTAERLAAHTQAVLQGGFILAKAQDDPAMAADSALHLRRYVELLFRTPTTTGESSWKSRKRRSTRTSGTKNTPKKPRVSTPRSSRTRASTA